ncbi:MAG: DNA polymerase III subunit beta [Chromatiales bacterium]|jgi:DNA polymerase III subunit beta|nr:DNA polymerase III subunit beta [Chromatiales bacterium]
MRFSIEAEALLKPLQAVHSVVERRQALPILSNVLMVAKDGVLTLTGTDMEVELVARTDAEDLEDGDVTVPARKFVDICRSLPADAIVKFEVDGERAVVKCGRSRFNLATLSAADYPASEPPVNASRVRLPRGQLKRLIELTQFAMAQQDVRYYLNGMLFELEGNTVRAVATDGHRLALAEVEAEEATDGASRQLIMPRKGVLELAKLLAADDEPVDLVVSTNAVRLDTEKLGFNTKLIDGRFPEYQRVIPSRDACDKEIIADREALRRALQRTAILSNEKYRAVRLSLESGQLMVVASNPEQEQAEDVVEVDYEGESLEIGFNVQYLIDALTTVPSESVRLYLTDSNSSCLILPADNDSCEYVVMPMRL